jgi:hypothetical protein
MTERVLVIQTDNGAEFLSRFHWHLEAQDIRHVYIRPRTPHLNGKVERSHRVDEQEFYQLLDKDGIAEDIHLFNDKLREWEGDYYNYHRPHGALDGQPHTNGFWQKPLPVCHLRLETLQFWEVVAGARLRLIARSSFRSRALTAAARLPASRFPTTVVTAIG